MKPTYSALAASAVAFAFLGVATAQDASTQGHHAGSSTELPAACQTTGEGGGMPDMSAMMENMTSMMGNMDAMRERMGDAQKAYMQGMMETEGPMMRGMMAEDPDVAFACAMIPHHQGAINMAEVLLQHGDSEEMKQMAEKIIAEQKTEIAEFTEWLEEQSQ